MIEGLKFRVPGAWIQGEMWRQATAKEERARKERQQAEAYAQLRAQLPDTDDECSPKSISVKQECIGKHWEEEARRLRQAAEYVVITDDYLLTKAEMDCLQRESEYHGGFQEASPGANTTAGW